ncbi:formylglycine-generating enzyme family protein [Candidatus Poribacteria bacterium]|nr:formylglycine-generating enzyme family protein [Candidatus Poribacteria bacterium]
MGRIHFTAPFRESAKRTCPAPSGFYASRITRFVIFLGLSVLLISFLITIHQGDGGVRADEPITPPGMIRIPAGEFIMGSDQGEPDERPAHRVFLKSYFIAPFEVTNAQYYRFWLADGGEKSTHTPDSYGDEFNIGDWPEIADTKPNHPVVGVSWSDAVAYAKWVGKRLPTEAEWEKAARGAKGFLWPWGNAFDLPIKGTRIHANIWNSEAPAANTLAPVGSYPTGASPYGVMDMAGNVWEWVADRYDESYYYRSPRENPQGPTHGSWRVVRGGSWANDAYAALSINRFSSYPEQGTSFIGFRLAKDAPERDEEMQKR